jgi:hypothetical protein
MFDVQERRGGRLRGSGVHPAGVPAGGDGGSVARPLLWLAAGLVAFVGIMVVIAPELLGVAGRDARAATFGAATVIVLIAAVPGLLWLAVAVGKRRSHDPHDDADGRA